MRPWSKPLAGKLEEQSIESALLRGNPRGDPHVRPLYVYTPPGYERGDRSYPSVYLLQGWTGQVDMWRNRSGLRPNAIELIDDLFERGALPAVIVFVDAWTSWGGSQYLDSPALGRYRSYLCDEIVPWVDAHYRTKADRDHRGLAGKSSGGYGAMVTAMARPDLFGGFATHAGDALFELCYARGFAESVRALRDEYGGSFAKFLDDHASRPAFSKRSDFTLLSDWSMSSCYSADPDGAVQLPYDTATGEVRPDVWARWLDKDPVRVARVRGDALRSMRGVYVDAGKRDEWFLDLGAQAFHREVRAAGAPEVFFELFDASHGQVEYRYPGALRWLVERRIVGRALVKSARIVTRSPGRNVTCALLDSPVAGKVKSVLLLGALSLVLSCRIESAADYCKPHPPGTFGCRLTSGVVYQPGCHVPSVFDEWCTCAKNKDGKRYEDCAQ
jgi:hypothetical protein